MKNKTTLSPNKMYGKIFISPFLLILQPAK